MLKKAKLTLKYFIIMYPKLLWFWPGISIQIINEIFMRGFFWGGIVLNPWYILYIHPRVYNPRVQQVPARHEDTCVPRASFIHLAILYVWNCPLHPLYPRTDSVMEKKMAEAAKKPFPHFFLRHPWLMQFLRAVEISCVVMEGLCPSALLYFSPCGVRCEDGGHFRF